MKKSYWLWLGVVAVVAAAAVLLLCLGGGGKTPSEAGGQQSATTAPVNQEDAATESTNQEATLDPTEKHLHTVKVTDIEEKPLENIGVYVYTDDTMTELVWFDTTNAEGEMTFTDYLSNTYVAVLSDVPEAYTALESYALTGLSTIIRLEGYEDPVYELGDTIQDFTITDSKGNRYTISELLLTKRAVVLNFWYVNCNPCAMEFPFMNEAYLKYRDQLEILAMSPMDKNADIAAYKAEKELDFLMAECDAKWEKMMQISGYPTTVVIDRDGVISFIHTGSVDNAEDFIKLFDFFTQEDYEPTLVKSFEELPEVEEEEKGTEENPFEVGGVTSFEITVKPETEFYVHLYKVQKMWLQVQAEALTVIYGETKYESSGGSVSFIVSAPDTNTPAKLIFKNTSKEEKTYTVYLSSQAGSFENPFTLKLGEVSVSVAAGNEQGVYYIFRPTEDGTLSLKCTKAPGGVQYDCVLNRIMAGDVVVSRSLLEDAEEGVVSTVVKKGESVKIVFCTMPDATNSYPGGNFVYLAEFDAGEVIEEEKVEELEYTVTVKDEEGNPIPNVNMSVRVPVQTEENQGTEDGTQTATEPEETTDGTQDETTDGTEDETTDGAEDETTDETTVEKFFSTNGEGIAVIKLPKGTYTVKLTLPEGYTAETLEYELTEEANAITVVLQIKKDVMVDYQVLVTDAKGQPMPGIMVRIGNQMVSTDEQGKAKVNLKQGVYTASVMSVPEGYVKPESLTLPEDGAETTFVLDYVPGSVNAPIDITETPYTTQAISGGQSVYYRLHNAGGMVLNIASRQAAVIIGSTTYGANSSGVVSVTLENATPIDLQIHNAGSTAGAFTLTLTHPVGSQENPQTLLELGTMTTTLEQKHTDGWHYNFTANETGTLSFALASVTNDAQVQIRLTNSATGETKTLTEDGETVDGIQAVSMEVNLGDVITVQITAADNAETQITTKSMLTPKPVDTRIPYTVTVVNEESQPQTGITVSFRMSGITVGSPVAVDENGVVSTMLEPGTYTVVLTLPDDSMIYDQASCVVSAENPNLTVVLMPKPDTTMDYTVHLTKDGAAYTGEVTVQILDSTEAVVSEGAAVDGTYTARLEAGIYTVALVLPDDTLEYAAVTLTQEAPEATVVLTAKVVTPAGMDYSVTVLSSKEEPQVGVWVQVKGTDYLAQTDDQGVAKLNMPAGNYTVELIFPDKTYYYNEAAAILSQSSPNLIINLAAEPGRVSTELGAINNAKAYVLSTGTTHLKVTEGMTYFSAEYDNNCFFMFMPTKAGTYRISLDRANVKLTDYNTPYYVFAKASADEFEDNALTFSVQKSQAGNITYVMGIQVTPGVTDVAVTITRVGEPGFSIEDVPFDTAWKSGYKPTAFTLPAGAKLTYIDVMNAATEDIQLVYSDSDKFYHLNDVKGPVVYLNMGFDAPYYSIRTIIRGDGAMGGAPIRAYFYSDKGVFIKKEDYTETFVEYMDCMDPTTGVYPLTKDLAYMIQNGCKAWWTPSNPAFEGSALKEANLEIAWMFACCYIAE